MKYFFKFFILIILIAYGCSKKQPAHELKADITSIIRTDTTAAAADTNQYLYDFIRMVEKDQKLDYSYGLRLETNQSLSSIEDDSYLWKFFKKTAQPIKTETLKNISLTQDSTKTIVSDSIITLKPTEPFIISSTTFPNRIDNECLTKSDITYMLAEKRRLQHFSWDNKRLGFNVTNKENWYVFSLPYFSKDKKTALISIRSLCPGLCGSGYVLLYRYEKNKWISKQVDFWVH